ncbi:hypothetical protein EJ06DRAFT_135420 [Trichodelitschia bisporula]|uniref:Uncharacterized protein n=1 Tax=Trichodelitschia bisporula TaxID=703511 RepID=A0A6G1HPS6_9PEZI|nr:hypothetical protein EJ06DRAFT_135420 [Trichodelitschia bisporula]
MYSAAHHSLTALTALSPHGHITAGISAAQNIRTSVSRGASRGNRSHHTGTVCILSHKRNATHAPSWRRARVQFFFFAVPSTEHGRIGRGGAGVRRAAAAGVPCVHGLGLPPLPVEVLQNIAYADACKRSLRRRWI